MTIGKDGELLIAAYGDGLLSVVGIAPGSQRVIPGPSVSRGRYGRDLTALAANRRDGTVYLADHCRVWRTGPGSTFEFFAGVLPEADCLATSPAPFHLAEFEGGIGGLAVDPGSGALYVADDAKVQRIDASGASPATIAGRARRHNADINRGFSGDGGPAIAARLNEPGSLAVDPVNGDLYIADQKNQRIRKVDASGVITTALGNGASRRPYEGQADDVAVDAVQVAIDGQGRLWATALPEGSSARDVWANRLITATLPRS
jgi:DNA-binding beta-propeller fold protein YncE